ncbi:MAG: agmatine deiminase family protein [Methanolinea sp.]
MTSEMAAPKIRIGLIQAPAGENVRENLERTLRMVEDALSRGARIICLQELFSAPYFPNSHGADAERYAETVPGNTTRILSDLARDHEAVIIAPLFERGTDGRFYNAAVIIRPDGTLGRIYRKVHIPEDPHYFEKEYFTEGSVYMVEDTPFGRIAVLICYDQWFPEAARAVTLLGAGIIFYPTALGYIRDLDDPCEGDWKEAWQTVQRGHAIANGIHVAAVNRVGVEGDLRFFGGSFLCDAFGTIIAEGGDSAEVVIGDVDLSMNDCVREGWGFLRNRRPDTYLPIVQVQSSISRSYPANAGYQMPAEWEPHQGVWLSWPYDNDTFFDLPRVEETYFEMIRALQGMERVFLLVRDQEMHMRVQDFLSGRGIDTRQVRFIVHEYADVWFRDYGPTFLVHGRDTGVAMVDWKFNAWGGKYPELEADDCIPSMLGRLLNCTPYTPKMVLEGGAIDVDGCGSLLTTEQCLLHPNRNPGMGRQEIETTLCNFLGVSRCIWLKGGIAGDDTDGHVDDVARFVNPRTVVCALDDDRESEHYEVLLENFRILKAASACDGSPLQIAPLPMPDALDEPVPASYTNFYIANGVVLVPTFNDPADGRALRTLQGLFETRRVIGIDCREMIRGMGAIHCVSQQFPSP